MLEIQFENDPRIAYVCGHCGRDVATDVRWRQADAGVAYLSAICPGCGAASLFTLDSRGGGAVRPNGTNDYPRRLIDQQPRPRIHTYSSEIVPEPVGRRYVDAQKAMQAGLWEQAIVTSRTAVQVMARLEEVPHGVLAKEIEALVEKRGTELADLVRSLAHRIRDAGNEAAHPDDPAWAPTKEEAEEALVFLQALIEWLYALPERLRKAEDAETAVESASASPQA